MIHVGCAFDEKYIPKMKQYQFLETFSQLSGVGLFALVTDGKPELLDNLRQVFPTVRFESVKKSDYRVPGQMAVLPSPQYGAFIDHTPWVKDDDHVLFIDGDITVQRQFHREEIDRFTSEPARAALTMNARGDGSMLTELLHLYPQAPVWQFEATFGPIARMPLYNLGVMGTTPPEWRRFLGIYERFFPEWDRMLRHHASNQFFMSWIWNTQDFKMYDPQSEFVKNFHSHCHEADSIRYFGLKRDPRTGTIHRNGQVVMLAHAHLHPAWQGLLV